MHARDPYKRVDTLRSSRRVQVLVGGKQVADSIRPLLLFETSLPTRYYLPFENVATDLLQASDTVTICPYKGQARYWSLGVGHTVVPDVAWSYPNPILENPKIATCSASSTSGSIWWSTVNLFNAPYPRGQSPTRQRSRRRIARPR
ncbi:MAG: DUF427 domain-containing protein [Actinomycetota bacterium]|nr:DUF427 domain-containing protein [Actinomycetota bacterium]